MSAPLVTPGTSTAAGACEQPVPLGRARESKVLERLLAGVRAGRSGALLVRGEAGVGKTALLDHLVACASDCRIARATGVESEMELPYAGLHQLCRPMLDHLDALPEPQQGALRVAFGMAEAASPDRFLVGLAVLSLASAVAEDQPLVCVVDDAQWLDRSSAQALGFVVRRLLADAIVIAFGVRDPHTVPELAGLDELRVDGLAEADAAALLRRVLPGPIDEPVLSRIVAETRGNPLALLELPRDLTPAQLAGGFGWPDAALLPTRIETSFVRRIERLPAPTQLLLLLAAAEPVGDPMLLWRGAARLGVGVDAALAGAGDLIEIGARVRFRHTLVRSAVYRVAPAEERRRVHLALAESIDPDVDPDRRAWHLANATAGPDEAVAAELETSAGRAQARGGLAAAGAFLERAAELTPDPACRARRTLAAAQAKHASGAADAALALLARAQNGHLDELGDARRQLLQGQIAFTTRRGRNAAALLIHAAQRLEPLDGALARATYLEAFWAAAFAGHLAIGGGRPEVAAAALAAPPAPEPRRPADLMLEGLMKRYADGYASGVPTLRRALREYRSEGAYRAGDLAWVWLAVDLWDDEAWHELGARQVQLTRDAGALSALPLALHTLAAAHTAAGELVLAESLIDEADPIMAATGDAPMTHSRLHIAALRRGADALPLLTSSIREATARGEGILVRHAEHAIAVVHNSLGDYDAAFAAAMRERDDNPSHFFMTAAPELVEAAVKSGRLEQAHAAVARLCEYTSGAGTDWGLGVEARSRALLADGAAAEELYREAIERLGACRQGVELARAHLLYGEWLRANHRRRDARAELRAAHERFTAMGAAPFAERACGGLQALGESPPAPGERTSGDELTAHEAQIARLARQGHSNPEIGAQLFLSPRTVEYHLAKVYTKLGIRSRGQLADALPPELVPEA
jgi:DNA-binding CsgD family transcriptional regulator